MSAPQAGDVRIFISHSSADNEFGIRLAEDLRRVLGDPTAVWFDASGGLHGGDAWWRSIVAEVTARAVFLVIWSSDARDSTWVNDEIDLAWQQKNDAGGKRIIPLLYRPCPLREDLRTRQVISFATPEEYEPRFTDLLYALGLAEDPSASAQRPAVRPSAPLSAPLSGPLLPSAPSPQPSAPPPVALQVSPQVSPQEATDATRVPAPVAPTVQQPPAAPPELLLLSIDRLWPPSRVRLERASITIGRESGNDVLVIDPAVSRFHLRLNRQGTGWHVAVVPGARPLFVNGEPREAAWLGHGDQLVIGGTVLRFELPGWFSTATTMRFSDSRTIRASGLTPELRVELPDVTFAAPLRGMLIALGRAPQSTLVIPSPLISAHHALLRRSEDGAYTLEAATDVPNRFVPEGQPAPPRPTLRHGETLLIGSRAQNRYVAITYAAPFTSQASPHCM
jgi:pSer/pThr/pTyr-binding forkhead associated (FHA) protein